MAGKQVESSMMLRKIAVTLNLFQGKFWNLIWCLKRIYSYQKNWLDLHIIPLYTEHRKSPRVTRYLKSQGLEIDPVCDHPLMIVFFQWNLKVIATAISCLFHISKTTQFLICCLAPFRMIQVDRFFFYNAHFSKRARWSSTQWGVGI